LIKYFYCGEGFIVQTRWLFLDPHRW